MIKNIPDSAPHFDISKGSFSKNRLPDSLQQTRQYIRGLVMGIVLTGIMISSVSEEVCAKDEPIIKRNNDSTSYKFPSFVEDSTQSPLSDAELETLWLAQQQKESRLRNLLENDSVKQELSAKSGVIKK